MKLTTKVFATLTLIITAFAQFSCDKKNNPEPSTEEVQLAKLSSTWKISEVKVNEVSKKTDYTNFQLVISGTSGASSFGYSTADRPSNSPWPASGTWIFGANAETQIIRDPDKTADKLDITYAVSDDGNQLQLNFNFAGTGYPARVSNVQGNWVFTFTK